MQPVLEYQQGSDSSSDQYSLEAERHIPNQSRMQIINHANNINNENDIHAAQEDNYEKEAPCSQLCQAFFGSCSASSAENQVERFEQQRPNSPNRGAFLICGKVLVMGFRPYSVWASLCMTTGVLLVYGLLLWGSLLGQLFGALLYSHSSLTLAQGSSVRLFGDVYYVMYDITVPDGAQALRLQWHSPVLNRTYSHVDSFPGSRVGRHKSDFFLSDERDIRPGQYLFNVHSFSSTKYALLSTQDDMAQVGLEPECYLRDCHFNQNMREKDLLPALNVHSVRIFKGVSKKLYDSATSSTKWIHYFLVVINVLLLLFFSRVFCEMILVRRLFLASPIFLIVLTIILGVIRKSSYSALVYFCSLFIIGFPFILLLALTVRIFIKRKTLELMHYDDPRRLLVLVQQMREVINQTQNSIHQLVETKRFSANQGNTFKYYCPICMLYFKSIMETTCCDQYICRDCVISFARSKGIIPEESVDLPESFPSTSCPYCTKTNFQVIVPSESEETKDYQDTPGQGKTRKDSPVLKIGDSFERMKAKMIKLESLAPLPDPEKSKSVTNSPVRDNCPLPPNTMSPAQLSSDHSLASEDQVREHQSSPVSVNRDNQEQQMHRVEHRTGILADGSLPRPPEQHADYDQMLPNTPSHSISVMRLGSLEFGPRNQ